jgi:signal transduction histidine kinase
LRNIIQHADATTVTITLRCDAKQLELQIEDNGKGFKLISDAGENPATRPRGNGLRHLYSRAQALGGQLEISSQPQRGTVLAIRIPMARIVVRAGK